MAATVAYTFGWRTQSEVLTLERVRYTPSLPCFSRTRVQVRRLGFQVKLAAHKDASDDPGGACEGPAEEAGPHHPVALPSP